ncbi:MAG: hypothetical protein ABSD75_25890 [Terriglobales bacterium]|jgi:hypothetical protein
MLHSITEVRDKIASGAHLLLAGSEQALRQLPKGNWIGGTTTYFMAQRGGVCSDSEIFVTEVPADAIEVRVTEYAAQDLPSLCKDALSNALTFIIIPGGSPAHLTYAQDAPTYEGIFERPVVGWVAGVHLSRIGKEFPKVFSGMSGTISAERAVVMHVALPQGKFAELEIVNVFKPGSGDCFSFPSSGFSAQECLIKGKLISFARYLTEIKHDCRLPLTADYNGSLINVSLQSVDADTDAVKFYAPVFPGVEYRVAQPVLDYVTAFKSAIYRHRGTEVFSCGCILNYLYGDLEGKQTGLIGPVTFGEIAHQLLNQTAVRLVIRDVMAKRSARVYGNG